MVGDATQRKSQKKLERAPEVRTREARAPEEILVSGVPEREALQEEAARSLDSEASQKMFILRNSWAWSLGELSELEEGSILP